MEKEKTIHCSFCGRSHTETLILVTAEPAYICDECVWVCVDVVEAAYVKMAARPDLNPPNYWGA